jgi:hypothetical protein
MRPTHLILALCLTLPFVASSFATPLPDIVSPDNLNPSRGASRFTPFVTGPATPIHSFYNDDLEISFWHGPADMTFDFAKNDVWDRRYLADGKHVITLADIRRVCFSDDPAIPALLSSPNGMQGCALGIPNTPNALYPAYDFPCPKPVGQLILRCHDLASADPQTGWTAGSSAASGMTARASAGPARGGLFSFLHRTKNLFVVRAEYSGLTQPLRVDLYRHRDTTPEHNSMMGLCHFGGTTGYDYSQDRGNGPIADPVAGADGKFFWIRQVFPADKTFPHGFESVMMARVVGVPSTTSAQDHVTGAGVKSTVHPIPDADVSTVQGYLKELRLAAQRVNDAPYGSLASATISAPDPSFTLYLAVVTTRDSADPLAAARKLLTDAEAAGPDAALQQTISATRPQISSWLLSRVPHYNATSCTFADATPWHGDYHWNETYMGDSVVAGDLDAIEQRLRLCLDLLPALRRNAREMYGLGGLAFSLVHYPIKTDRVVYSNVVWELGAENTALMLQAFWQRYQCTQDLAFLKRAYPLIADAARFYCAYVTRGDDGLYHVVPTVSQEHRGLTPRFALNRDSVGSLSFLRYHLKAALAASDLLGLDAADRPRWHEVLDHLAPYPTLQTPQGPVFCDVAGAPDILNYNITANLVMTLWAEDISMDSAPDLVALARRSYDAIPDKEHSSRGGYLQQIAMSLGILKTSFLTPQGRVLSWPGRIHLYAGLPDGASCNDQFSGLLAMGGFEVAADHHDRDVRSVRITSVAGHVCRVKNPWPSSDVAVLALPSRDVIPHKMDGDTIVFPTRAGATYALLGGPDFAKASLRFARDENVIGAWSFSGPDAANPHPAKLVGAASLRTADGATFLHLTGDAQYASVDRFPALDFAPEESFAIEVRFRTPAGPPPFILPLVCSMSTKQYCLTLFNGRADLYLSSPAGDIISRVTGTSILTDGRWHTVRAVRDVAAGVLRMSVDGAEEATAADTTAGDFACTAPLTIGAYLWGDHTRYAAADFASATLTSLGHLTPR